MSQLATVLFLLVGVVNLLPCIGVVSSLRIESLYGIPVAEPNLAILMRHRAVLFGVVGGLLVYGALHPPARAMGVAAGLLSMLSFVVIAWLVGGANAELRRVVVVDGVASAALVLAAVVHFALVSRSPVGV